MPVSKCFHKHMSFERLTTHGVDNDHEFVPDGYYIQKLANKIADEFSLQPKERPRHGNTHVSHIVTAEGVAESSIHLCAHPGSQREAYSVTASSEGITLGRLSVEESTWEPVNGTADEVARRIMGRLGYLSPTKSDHSN